MGVSGGPDMIQDGLVLSLDASDKNSYTGSGTTWSDISGNGNNGTLILGPTFNSENGGSIVFDGTNDYVSTTLISTTSFTWIAWFKTDVVSNGFRNIISIRGPSYILMLMDNDTSDMGFWTSDSLGGESLNMTGISTNVWYQASFIREGNSVTGGYKTYLNGSFRGSANTGIWSSSDPVILGGRTDATQYFDGNIASTQIYNRALSASEILQNYNATKNRFGLK